jgi:hypothetical protein
MGNLLDSGLAPCLGLDLAISLDRKGTSDCIYTQLGRQCSSPEFAEAFCDELLEQGGLAYDLEHGLVTDSALLRGLVPQILNLSIGYYYNHSKREVISVQHIDKLGCALARMPWRKLQELAVEYEWQDIELDTIEKEDDETLYDIGSDRWESVFPASE